MLAPYLKAVYGALVAGVAAALSYLQGGGTNAWTAALLAASAGLAALGIVFAVPNAPKAAKR